MTVGTERLVSLAGVIEGFRNWMHSYETNTMYSGHDVAILMTGVSVVVVLLLVLVVVVVVVVVGRERDWCLWLGSLKASGTGCTATRPTQCTPGMTSPF